MKTEHLLYFTKVVELSSITLASEHLYVSPQAISAAIKTLEKTSGVKLFIRIHNGLVATKEGLYIYEKAKKILTLVNDIENSFTVGDNSDFQETLNIAVTTIAKKNILNKITTYFMKTYPNVHLNFIHLKQHDIIDAVLNGQADLGFYSYLRIDDKEYHGFTEDITFKAYDICAFDYMASMDSPFSNYASISIKSLANQRLAFTSDLIHPKSCLYPMVEHYHLFDNTWLVDSDELHAQILSDNLAGSLSPRSFLHPFPNIIYIPVTDNIRLISGYLEKNDTEKKRSAQIFIDKFIELHMKASV